MKYLDQIIIKFGTLFTLIMIIMIIIMVGNAKAQTTKALHQLFPMDLVDQRSSLKKSVMGIGSSVNVTLNAGIKNIDACHNETDFGSLNVEIRWYNAKDEAGKFTLQLLKEMNGAKTEKENFLREIEGKAEDFARGTLKISSKTKACVNEITGSTGKMEYTSEARYFSFNENRILKITFSDKMKPETARKIILKIADEVAKFDFSVYSKTVE